MVIFIHSFMAWYCCIEWSGRNRNIVVLKFYFHNLWMV